MIREREREKRKLIFVSALGEKNDYRDDKFEVRTQMPRGMSANINVANLSNKKKGLSDSISDRI